MRVLWFTNTSSNYAVGENPYNGGGWISSLETELTKNKEITLGIAFRLDGQPGKIVKDNVCYYPIENPFSGSFFGRIRGFLTANRRQQVFFLDRYEKVIADFRPDIIHVFGTEQDFGLIAEHVNIPIIIQMQGILNPYLNAFLPPGIPLSRYLFTGGHPLHIAGRMKGYVTLKSNARREIGIFENNRHFIGRTEWDRSVVSIFNPYASYDFCSEILREVFYTNEERELPPTLVITTTISGSIYKGYDVVLKCAQVLKSCLRQDFEWRVYGNVDKRIERMVGISADNVNVKLLGVASPESIKTSIMQSTLFVHPSYIDNSPNSVCEAQILGCTVIGQFVGGLDTLIRHGETGILVSPNDPYRMAYFIKYLWDNPSINEAIGRRAAEEARLRHDKDKIVCDTIYLYKKYRVNNND